jgi:16S rRNA (guanine1207-N2)-methyltransferase
MKTWTTPWGALSLGRQPYDGDPALQAWSAADAVLARWALETSPAPDRQHVVYNDAFGALTTLLISQGRAVTQVSDSCLSQRCTLWNLDANGMSAEKLVLLDSLTAPKPGDSAAEPPVVLYRLPKSLALLEFQLHQLRSFLPPGTVVAASGMVKDVHTSTLDLFQKLIGPTATDLAEQKARLIRSTLEDRTVPANPYPSVWAVPALGVKLVNHASVFSRDGLDGGTTLLLRHFPKIGPGERTIIDLGCGNGILGLAAARRAPEAEVYCVDESFMAVWSAREGFRLNELGGRGSFLAGDGLEDFGKASADLILCNPPFHYQNAQTLEIALSLFDQARDVLKADGELWVVANRHLGHHKALADRFTTVRTAALDEKYIVLRARNS